MESGIKLYISTLNVEEHTLVQFDALRMSSVASWSGTPATGKGLAETITGADGGYFTLVRIRKG